LGLIAVIDEIAFQPRRFEVQVFAPIRWNTVEIVARDAESPH